MLILQILFQKCREVDMAGRNLGLNERVEDSREPRSIIPPIYLFQTEQAQRFVVIVWKERVSFI